MRVAAEPVMGADERAQLLLSLRREAAAPRLAEALLLALEELPAQPDAPLPEAVLQRALATQGLRWEDARLGRAENLLEAWAGGAMDPLAAATSEALLALGLDARLQADRAGHETCVAQWLSLADALLLRSGLNPYRFLTEALSEALAELVLLRLGDRVASELAEDGAARGRRPAPRLRVLLRLDALTAALPRRLLDPLLARTAASCATSEARRLLTGYLGDPAPASSTTASAERPPEPGDLALEGWLLQRRRGPWATLLASLSGWSLLSRSAALVARALLGAGQRARLELRGGLLHLERRRRLLGRETLQQEQIVPLGALLAWGGERRRPEPLILLGVFSFCLGAVLGLGLLFDSLRAGFPLFGLVGLGIVGLGAALDLGLTAWAQSQRAGRGTVWLQVAGQGRLELQGVSGLPARRFVEALSAGRAELEARRSGAGQEP